MQGEVQILVPSEEKTFMLPKNNKYAIVIDSNEQSKRSETSNSDFKPTESDYQIALLAHCIINFERIAWLVSANAYQQEICFDNVVI